METACFTHQPGPRDLTSHCGHNRALDMDQASTCSLHSIIGINSVDINIRWSGTSTLNNGAGSRTSSTWRSTIGKENAHIYNSTMLTPATLPSYIPQVSSPVLVLDRPLIRHQTPRRLWIEELGLGSLVVAELPLQVRQSRLGRLSAVRRPKGAAVSCVETRLVRWHAGRQELVVLLGLGGGRECKLATLSDWGKSTRREEHTFGYPISLGPPTNHATGILISCSRYRLSSWKMAMLKRITRLTRSSR